jgi:glutamyl-tRNA reductase
MKKSLGYISISHKTATVTQREIYQVSDEEKNDLFLKVSKTYPDISGLFMLITCNRSEIYFESSTTTADTLCDYFIAQRTNDNLTVKKKLFDCSYNSSDTVKHLLEVASGLESSVLGDAEIIHQIKKAHQFSLKQGLQGSLLERAMQAVFRCHKRISNETNFRDGTTSLAYKTLKLVSDHLTMGTGKSSKILFVGAGDIIKQLFKYNAKFNFKNIYISNRTEENAAILANKNQAIVYDWDKVLNNDLEIFDVIVSAVSNRHHLIHNPTMRDRDVLLIDLAVPTNIDETLAANRNITVYDLDTISKELEVNMAHRADAVNLVDIIIAEELIVYKEWLQKASFRESLAKQKLQINRKLSNYFETHSEENSEEMIKIATNRILKRIINGSDDFLTSEEIDGLILNELKSVHQIYV